MIVFGRHLIPWLEAVLGDGVDPETMCFASLDSAGAPTAVFGFSGWRDNDVEGTLVAIPGGVTRAMLRACARYVFGTMNCDRLTIRVRADNTAMRALSPRLGFTHEGTLRAAHEGHDVLIYGMLRAECRWLSTERPSNEETQGAGSARPDQDHPGADAG